MLVPAFLSVIITICNGSVGRLYNNNYKNNNQKKKKKKKNTYTQKIPFIVILVETAGHIPGAKNLPISKLVDNSERGVLQPVDKLKQCKLELEHDKTNKMACAPSEDSDQPGHSPSLIRIFAVRMKKPGVLSYPLSAQRRF